ncbi:MAG: glycosyltransferase family 2 protein [Planctomycetota bacterium]|nr:glycosyltransferase family 2 protein [Planctomycetota bacterium]
MRALSVIFTTYNATAWLEKVLWGFACQSHGEFEVIIADDGSKPETGTLISRLKGETGLDITHVWHEDDGFRKCRILNKAILQAAHEYIVFTDGDCIPHRDFLKTHAAIATPGRFASGSYFRLSLPASEAIERSHVESGECFKPEWLQAQGMPRSKQMRRLVASPLVDRIMSPLTMRSCTLKGGNAGVWRSDLLAANGYDERLGYGGQDRELGVRLQNAGIRPLNARYKTTCIHLEHPRGYADPAIMARNKAILRDTAKSGRVRAELGIQELLDEGYRVQG